MSIDKIKFDALFVDRISNAKLIQEELVTLARIIARGVESPDSYREDIQQETYIAIFVAVPKLNPEAGSAFNYLYRVGQRAAWRYAQKVLRHCNREQNNRLNESGDATRTDSNGREFAVETTSYSSR